MVDIPASLGVNTDGPYDTIDKIVVQVNCILVRDAKSSLSICEEENQLILLSIFKVMLIIVDNIYLVKNPTVSFNQQLLTILINIDLLDHQLTKIPGLSILKQANKRW